MRPVPGLLVMLAHTSGDALKVGHGRRAGDVLHSVKVWVTERDVARELKRRNEHMGCVGCRRSKEPRKDEPRWGRAKRRPPLEPTS